MLTIPVTSATSSRPKPIEFVVDQRSDRLATGRAQHAIRASSWLSSDAIAMNCFGPESGAPSGRQHGHSSEPVVPRLGEPTDDLLVVPVGAQRRHEVGNVSLRAALAGHSTTDWSIILNLVSGRRPRAHARITTIQLIQIRPLYGGARTSGEQAAGGPCRLPRRRSLRATLAQPVLHRRREGRFLGTRVRARTSEIAPSHRGTPTRRAKERGVLPRCSGLDRISSRP